MTRRLFDLFARHVQGGPRKRGVTIASAAGGILPRPAAIVWDWDNTLVDGWAAIAAGLNAAFAAFGLPRWTVEEVRARVRRSLRESFPEMFGAEWERARDIFYAEVRARHLRVLSPDAGRGGGAPRRRGAGACRWR